MDGVTDFLMRELLTEVQPFSYCVTEFIRVSALVPSERVFLTDVPELNSGCRTLSGAPIQVQLLGGDPEKLAASALRAVELGAQGIDLNFGCPAPTVNRHDGGATLLKFPERIEAIVSAVRAAVPLEIPVSAKLRLGWDSMASIHENAERAARGGASWITIHGRTKMQGYTPPAYWRPIGEVRANVGIPVVANGEIWTIDDLKRCQEETGCEHFMIGRGALAEPGVVRACAQYLGMQVTPSHVGALDGDPKLWRDLLTKVVARSTCSNESERRTVSRLKQWLNYAHKRETISWFDELKRLSSYDEILGRLDTYASNPSEREAA
jgi:tRNA-dihydrouridine synthase C